MLNLGKKYQFTDNNSDNMTPTSVCLLICQSGCNSSANVACSCSKKTQRSKSYKSNWNSLHMDWVAPDGG